MMNESIEYDPRASRISESGFQHQSFGYSILDKIRKIGNENNLQKKLFKYAFLSRLFI